MKSVLKCLLVAAALLVIAAPALQPLYLPYDGMRGAESLYLPYD